MHTETAIGFIPHAPHPEYGFLMPVKLKRIGIGRGYFKTATDRRGRTTPETIDGKLVYALPGGGSIVL